MAREGEPDHSRARLVWLTSNTDKRGGADHEVSSLRRACEADERAGRLARAAYDRLAYSHKREHVRAIESAKKPETRTRRIEKAVAMLRAGESATGRAARAKIPSGKSPRSDK